MRNNTIHILFSLLPLFVVVGTAACSTRTPVGDLGDAGIGTGGQSGTGGTQGIGGLGGIPEAVGGMDVPLPGTGGSDNVAGGGGTGGGGTSLGTGGDPRGSTVVQCVSQTGVAGASGSVGVSFLPPAVYPMGGFPFYVALCDVNGDGKPDLAVATSRPSGSGGAPVIANGTGGSGVVNFEPGGVNVLLNGANGVFGAAKPYDATSPSSVAVADVTGDGKPDLVIASGAGNVEVLSNQGNGSFAVVPSRYSVGTAAGSIAAGDLNGDGKTDIAVTAQLGNGQLGPASGIAGVLLNAGGGSFVGANYAAGSRAIALAMGDVNGDGKLDLVVADFGGGVNVLLNNGSGAFSSAVTYAAGTTPVAVAVGDLNADGKPDIAIATNNSFGAVGVLSNLGNGTFSAPVVYQAPSAAQSVTMGDLTGDGIADLVITIADEGCASVGVLVNKGNGTFNGVTTLPMGGTPQSAVVGDVNGDGKPDLVVTNSQQVSVLINAR